MRPWQMAGRLRRGLVALSLLALLLGLTSQPGWGQPRNDPPAPFVPGEILVKLKPGFAAKILGQAAPGLSLQADASPELAELGVTRFRVPSDQLTTTLAALQQNPLVEYAEPNYLVQATDIIPNDQFWGSQWGPPDIQAPQAWSVTTGSISVTIAIIDTGIDLNHPEFVSKIDPQRWNFLNNTSNVQDDNGHGTHVAGIAAAIGNNNNGIAGMAWGVQIMPLKALNSAGQGTYADVASAIDYAADHGAQVINLSLGGTTANQTLQDAVTYAYGKGVTIVAAAGNAGSQNILYPAACTHVIAVAAVNSNNTRWSSSNYGPQMSLAAPGSSIYSTCLGGSGYCTMTGTSMATPHVAGTAALLASLPRFDSPDKIRTALENTALDLTADPTQSCPSGPGWDPCYGYGLVQAYNALNYSYHVDVGPTAGSQFASPGREVSYTLTITNTGVLTDTFTASVSAGSLFTNTLEATNLSNLAPFASLPATVTVTIPETAAMGTYEIATVTVSSNNAPAQHATAAFTTRVPYTIRLPLIFR